MRRHETRTVLLMIQVQFHNISNYSSSFTQVMVLQFRAL